METVEQMLRNESNPEVLRGIAIFINDQAKKLAEEVKTLKAQRDREEAEKQEWLNREIRSQLNKLRKRTFDQSRETLKSSERKTPEDELLMHAKSLVGDIKNSEVKKKLPEEHVQCFATSQDLLALAQKKDPTLTFENAEMSEINGLFETSSE